MEQDQERSYSCKLCRKRFVCGRSLGGHMKSHVMNLEATQTKLSSLIYGRINALTNANHENSKKVCKLADSSENTMFLDKVCRECGKIFPSWKALFGHMKSHSEKVSITAADDEDDDDDSWISQSDDETLERSTSRKRSPRIKKYRATDAISTSLSASTSSEIDEQEQEEVAICLMMLSRDVGDWGESFDNQSELLGAKIVIAQVDAKKISKVDVQFEMEKSDSFEADNLVYKRNYSSRRKRHYYVDQKVNMEYSAKLEYVGLVSEEKKSKFECGTCSKTFHSYQALGGHRASHKKQKSCSTSTKFNSTHQFSRYSNNSTEFDHGKTEKTISAPKKNKGSHECPICFRIFSSGQALGGHKRSHVIAAQKAEPIQEDMREFLDLNMPAPSEEETGNINHAGFNRWWVQNSQKHEPFIGLVSN